MAITCGSDRVMVELKGEFFLPNSAKFLFYFFKTCRGAVVGGEEDGVELYIGRVCLHQQTIVGKVHPGHGVLYGALHGSEIFFHNYELLVRRPAGGSFLNGFTD